MVTIPPPLLGGESGAYTVYQLCKHDSDAIAGPIKTLSDQFVVTYLNVWESTIWAISESKLRMLKACLY